MTDKVFPSYDEYRELLKAQAYSICKQFLYEPNSTKTRTEVVNRLGSLFSPLKELGIVFDYYIVCDDTNNTDESIDRNELNVRYAVKVADGRDLPCCQHRNQVRTFGKD